MGRAVRAHVVPRLGNRLPPSRPNAINLRRASMRALRECTRGCRLSSPVKASGGRGRVYLMEMTNVTAAYLIPLHVVLDEEPGERAASQQACSH